MATPEYLQATRFRTDGREENVAHLLLTTEYCSHNDYDRMVVRLYPLSFVRRVNGREIVEPFITPYRTTPYRPILFDLMLDHTNGYQGAYFAVADHFVLPSDLQDRGIGSYVLSGLIEWGVSLAPYYPVVPLRLGSNDARTDKARDHRNGFYKAFGLDFHFEDPEQRTGWCCAEALGLLTPHYNKTKVKVAYLWDIVRTYQIENQVSLFSSLPWSYTCTSRTSLFSTSVTRSMDGVG